MWRVCGDPCVPVRAGSDAASGPESGSARGSCAVDVQLGPGSRQGKPRPARGRALIRRRRRRSHAASRLVAAHAAKGLEPSESAARADQDTRVNEKAGAEARRRIRADSVRDRTFRAGTLVRFVCRRGCLCREGPASSECGNRRGSGCEAPGGALGRHDDRQPQALRRLAPQACPRITHCLAASGARRRNRAAALEPVVAGECGSKQDLPQGGASAPGRYSQTHYPTRARVRHRGSRGSECRWNGAQSQARSADL